MKLPVNRLQPIAIDVRVMLRRANVGVTKQLLHQCKSAPAS